MMTQPTILIVFFLSLALRLTYFGYVGQEQMNLYAPDSRVYNSLADDMLMSNGFNRRVGTDGIFIPETERVPVYVAYLAGIRAVFGRSPVWPAMGQCLFDAITCVGIGMLAARFRADLFLLAGVCAAFNLNLIVHSTMILSDSLFLLPFTLMLLCTVRFIQKPMLSDALLAGCFTALALLTRSMLLYFVPVLLLVVVLAARRHAAGASSTVRYVAACALPLVILVGPLIQRNYSAYGHFSLVSQGGGHVLFWVVPLAREFSRGVPFARTQDEMRQSLASYLSARGLEKPLDNPFESSDLHMRVATQALRDMSMGELALAWAVGAGINLFAPSVASVPFVSQMDRPRFYGTPGNSPVGKIWNVLRESKGVSYLAWIIPAGLFTVLIRFLQAWGTLRLARNQAGGTGPLLYLLVVAVYVLAITGPLVGVKYRLPLEPILVVLTAAAIQSLLMSRWGLALQKLFLR
jgi:hypothetical protein